MIAQAMKKKQHFAFFDSAYQGFATGDLISDSVGPTGLGLRSKLLGFSLFSDSGRFATLPSKSLSFLSPNRSLRTWVSMANVAAALRYSLQRRP